MSYRITPAVQHLSDHILRIRKISFTSNRFTDEYSKLPIIKWLEDNIGKMYQIENRVQLFGDGWMIGVNIGVDSPHAQKFSVHIVNDTDSKLITEFIMRFV